MTDCVSRTERSSDVSVASVTTASGEDHRSRARINVSSLMNKTKTHLEIGCWRGGLGAAYLSPCAMFQRPGACSEGLLGRRIRRLACAFHQVAGTRDALGVTLGEMGERKGHPQ